MGDVMRTWFVVDDQPDDVKPFCASFLRETEGRSYDWRVLSPSQAGTALFGLPEDPLAGVLIDIDLSREILGTGLGLAQDLRAKQKNNEIADYPIVRFANLDPVKKYVGADPVSDDLFDLFIGKDRARQYPRAIVDECIAVRMVYDILEPRKFTEEEFARVCGLAPERFEVWGDIRFYQRVSTRLDAALHAGAGTYIRSFLLPDGLLIGEDLLAVRLGVDREASGQYWETLKSAFRSASYEGPGAAAFERWWARGIEAIWFSIDPGDYLHELTVTERISKLSEHFALEGLVPLQPSNESPGDRYWRLCTLSKERSRIVPVDPRNGVNLTSAVQPDPWLEPEQAALGIAAMEQGDARLAKLNLKRPAG